MQQPHDLVECVLFGDEPSCRMLQLLRTDPTESPRISGLQMELERLTNVCAKCEPEVVLIYMHDLL